MHHPAILVQVKGHSDAYMTWCAIHSPSVVFWYLFTPDETELHLENLRTFLLYKRACYSRLNKYFSHNTLRYICKT